MAILHLNANSTCQQIEEEKEEKKKKDKRSVATTVEQIHVSGDDKRKQEKLAHQCRSCLDSPKKTAASVDQQLIIVVHFCIVSL